jgi:hypothetical protein
MARTAVPIELSDEQRAELDALLRRRSTPQQLALRARIVLRAAEGVTNTQIADELDTSLPTVGQWRNRYAEHGLDGLRDAPRSGRPRQIDDTTVQAVIAKTLEPPPPGRVALVGAPAGGRARTVAFDGAPHLARPRSQAASVAHVQVLQRF